MSSKSKGTRILFGIWQSLSMVIRKSDIMDDGDIVKEGHLRRLKVKISLINVRAQSLQ